MSKVKKLLIASLSVALAGAIAIPVTGAIVKASNTPVWEDVTIASEYLVDETLNIPTRTLSIGGEDYAATIEMTYPNGSKRSVQSGDFALTTAGEYTLTYSARVSGIRYTETEEFFVANKLWSVKDAKSSAVYGKVGETDALLVRLAKGDTLTFNKVIDLSNYDPTDATNVLFKGFINPDTIGSNDFEKLIITFTDAYDPSQVMTVRGNKSTGSVNAECGSYWTAAGSNQTLGGWDRNGKNFAINGTKDSGICGTYRAVSFCSVKGVYSNADKKFHMSNAVADTEHFTIVYNADTKGLSVRDRSNVEEVADFDKPEYYPSEPLWGGFTSNKVIVSVTADGYAAETANFAISDLFGYDLSVENRFVEEDAPELTVDVDDKYVEYDAKTENYSFIPVAIKGGNYPVPTATAFDAYSGNVKVSTKVYFDYQNGLTECQIKNGTFAVNSAGWYTIVYTAKDNNGNEAVREYWIKAVESIDNPVAISVDASSATKSSVCGVRIPLATCTTTGGSGDVNVTITATCGDTTLDVSDGVLLAEKAGTWTVTYTAKDYSGITATESYDIAIDWGTQPVFLDTPTLPRYFISGMRYTVPTVKAYDYSTGVKVDKTASLVVTDKNGVNTYEAGATYVPEVDETGALGIAFKCDNVTIPLDVTAVDPLVEMDGMEVLLIENMFVGEGFKKESSNEGLILTAEANEDFSWIFANAIAAEGASLKIKGVAGYSAFDAFEVTLTDYADPSIAVTMRIKTNAKGTAQVKFGGMDRELTKGLNMPNDGGKVMNEFEFSYKLGEFYVDSIGVKVATDNSGKAFSGFPSGKVYISAEAIGVSKGQQYLIMRVDNHIVKNNIFDTTAPKIAINGSYGGMYNIQEEYEVNSAIASDVIDPNVECTVTVKSPSYQVVSDVNGVLLENVPADQVYTIVLTEYGQYQVTYNAKDWANKKGSSFYAVNVFDRKAPRAAITGEWSATANVGETVVLPEVEISDDFSDFYDMKVYRMVRNPFDVLTTFGYDYVLVEEGKETDTKDDDRAYWNHIEYSFTFKYAGNYKFIIVVYDAAGNQTLLEYVVTVS